MQTLNSEQRTKSINLIELYGDDGKTITHQKDRYKKLSDSFIKQFSIQPEYYFSTPGRTEISGNHTDHNNGKVIAASISLDSIAAVSRSNDVVEIFSDGYDDPFIVDLNELNVIDNEVSTTNSLIRGIAAGFKQHGFNIGGFKAFITSDVLKGSGLSSSASIEVLIGTIFNHLYNDGTIIPEEIGKIGQYAENVYFKKPCGLMDQMACASGGIISIDFKDSIKPVVEKLDFNFAEQKYSLVFIHTGGSHISLTDDYSSIPNEMKSVACYFGKKTCREVSFDHFIDNIKFLREKVSDRAILRAYHFFNENIRVDKIVNALKNNNLNLFLKLVNESGDSSFKYLQNIFSPKDVIFQATALAIAFAEEFINSVGSGAVRIHGGGFEGTIQVMIPTKYVKQFSDFINKVFNNFNVYNLNIRQIGTTRVVYD